MKTLEELNERIKRIELNRCTSEEVKETIEELKKMVGENNLSSKHIIPILENCLEQQQLYEGIYEGKNTIFKHDLDLHGKYPIGGFLTIVDKKTNKEITICVEDVFQFVHLIEREISENINSEYDLTHHKRYYHIEENSSSYYFEDNRQESIPKNNDAGKQLVKAICHDNIIGTSFLN